MFITNKKEFYKDTLHIALPLATQFLVSNLLNLVDTIMVGSLGEQQLAGVSAGNNLFFIFAFFVFGIAGGTGVFSAQFFGAGNEKGIRHIAGMSLIFCIFFALVFMFIGIFTPQSVIKLFSSDKAVIDYGVAYVSIVLWSYIPTAIIESYSAILKSTSQVKIPLYVAVIALGINTILNYILIYGKLGFPAYGVKGAAIATLIARIIEVVLLFMLVYSSKHILACNIKKLFGWSKELLTEFLKVSSPVVLNESLWSLGIMVYAMVYGKMGTSEFAAYTIIGNIERIFMFIFFGMAYASLAIVGRKIGEGKSDVAYEYAISYSWLAVILGAFSAVLLALLSPFLLSFYSISAQTYDIALKVLIVLSVFTTAKMFNFITLIGTLRSGGDTIVVAALDLGGIWLLGVPMALIGGIWLKYPMPVVYAMTMVEELIKCGFAVWRLRSKKWINVL